MVWIVESFDFADFGGKGNVAVLDNGEVAFELPLEGLEIVRESITAKSGVDSNVLNKTRMSNVIESHDLAAHCELPAAMTRGVSLTCIIQLEQQQKIARAMLRQR